MQPSQLVKLFNENKSLVSIESGFLWEEKHLWATLKLFFNEGKGDFDNSRLCSPFKPLSLFNFRLKKRMHLEKKKSLLDLFV